MARVAARGLESCHQYEHFPPSEVPPESPGDRGRPDNSQGIAWFAGASILGEEVEPDEGGSDAFAEVANTLAGRLRQSLADRGVILEQQAPTILSETADGPDPLGGIVIAFQAASGERFVLQVRVGG